MNFLGPIITLLLSLTVAAHARFTPELAPGQTSRFNSDRYEAELLLYLPENYTADRDWPVIFHYHSSNAKPDVDLLRKFTDGRDYVIVGMSYLKRQALTGSIAADRRQAIQELQALASVHRALKHEVSLVNDPLLAGVGKGGWMVSRMAELKWSSYVGDDLKLSGAVILLTGRAERNLPLQYPGVLTNMPVYIGAGELDESNIAAQMAAIFYRQQGAIVTIEEYDGLRHQLPTNAPRLNAWFKAQLYVRLLDEDSRQALILWFTQARLALNDIGTSLVRYNHLLEMQADPRLRLCGANALSFVRAQLAEARREDDLQQRIGADELMQRVIQAEMRAESRRDLHRLQEAWRQLGETYPETPGGQRATREVQRLGRLIGPGDVLAPSRPATP